VVQDFLVADLVDRIILTRVPVLLGGGTELFGELPEHLAFSHHDTVVLPRGMIQSTYQRVRT
jgi:dihydrofolate reductase